MANEKKVEWLERAVFQLPFWAVCFSQEEFDAVAKELGGLEGPVPYISGGADATTHILELRREGSSHPEAACIVSMPYEESPDNSWIALATHEAWHVVGVMKRMYRGAEWCEEQEAVMIQMVVARILESLADQIDKRKKPAPKKRTKKK